MQDILFLLLLAGAIASVTGFMDSVAWDYVDKCTEQEFKCRNGRCVSKTLRCDSVNHCGDYSDEEDCELHSCKEPNFFRCKNGKCVDRVFVCDGENDCEDFSDEEKCENFQLAHMFNVTCNKNEWQCTDKLCIPQDLVCNGQIECLDGSDETVGCKSKTNCTGFQCKNHQCILAAWECDGVNDCGDNSDEINCKSHFDPAQCTLDNRKFLCSNNASCISVQRVCDGRPDCSDKSDEGRLCHNSGHSCANKGCSHDCVELPDGPKCLCPMGYRSIGEKQCDDINECEIYGICDQKCKNTPGSYECSCVPQHILQEDKRTCKPDGGEALMVFSSKTEIRAYMLTSQLYFPVARHLKQVVGVDYDGHHVYWSEVVAGQESIVKAMEDGSNSEMIVTNGLGQPEDLAVDWLTGNVYFTDVEKKHIGVCTNDGRHCCVLVNEGVRKPRAIVLHIDQGKMYWSDWGKPAEIAVADMDGSNYMPFVSSNIKWPNGLALDYPNERLYWTDAKKATLESIRLDGTDRRIILEGIVKHPYAIALFENRLYWSEWDTHSLQSCDKFTGKNHSTVIVESKDYIYGISIFHPSLRNRVENPCTLAYCSDICLLKGAWYSCACPEHKTLQPDRHSCKEKEKPEMLIVGAKDTLLLVQHQKLGKHAVRALPTIAKDVGCLAYNALHDKLYISDLATQRIVEYDLKNEIGLQLNINGLGQIVSMDYDPIGNNLYMCDKSRASLEVVSLTTLTSKTLIHDTQDEVPESVALVPQEGVMFVALTNTIEGSAHIDRMFMDGSGRTRISDDTLVFPISLHYDYVLDRIFYADAGTGMIETIGLDGDERHEFRSLSSTPTDITSLSQDVFWVNEHSRTLYWADKSSSANYNQKLSLSLPGESTHAHLVAISKPPSLYNSPCHNQNGNCSSLCLVSHKSNTVCACPARMQLAEDNRRCVMRLECHSGDFFCPMSNECVLGKQRCDGHKDCSKGEDEANCDAVKIVDKCGKGYFGCRNGECIEVSKRCDHNFDCKDKSDEHDCDHIRKNHCPKEHFQCANNGKCISERFVCDGFKDCEDNSDERNCLSATCDGNQFRCDSGACIPKSWECDLEYDCKDLSDEHSNCAFNACPSNEMFRCDNGKCLHPTLRCDGTDDCGDLSDENDCLTTTICEPTHFPCASNQSICVPHSAACNGTKECPRGEDETDCTSCNPGTLQCKNKKCVEAQWLCDGTDDCGDGTDESEEFCKSGGSLKHTIEVIHAASVPCDHGFRCKTGSCINLDAVCNGKPDCYDGSDENGLCSESCQGLHSPCSQDCVKTPHGPQCKCKPGYRLLGDGHSCVDEDECSQHPPICSQLCFNSLGSYHCDCYKGFLLRSDKKSCKASGDPMSLIFIADNQIRQLSQKNNTLTVLYAEEMPQILGVDIHVKTGDIYFILDNSDTIQRINLKTKTRQYIEHVGRPQKIALDWSTGNVYYFNAERGSKSIGVCSFEGMVCTKIVDIDVHRHVSELAVDSVNKLMFYSLASWWVFNSPNFVIYKANLDGTGKTELVKSTTGYVSGLAYDHNKRELYYLDQHQSQIYAIKYDSTTSEILYSNLTRPVGLKFFENQLYYSRQNGFIDKCSLYGAKKCESFRTHADTHDLFVISQSGVQPDVVNVCQDNKCDYVCVNGNTGPVCLCDGGVQVGDKGECPDGASKRSSENGDERQVKLHSMKLVDGKQNLKQTSGGFVTAVVICVCMIALGAALIYYARRRHRGENLSVSMRFYNPKHHNDEKPILQPGQHEYSNPVLDTRCQTATNTSEGLVAAI